MNEKAYNGWRLCLHPNMDPLSGSSFHLSLKCRLTTGAPCLSATECISEWLKKQTVGVGKVQDQQRRGDPRSRHHGHSLRHPCQNESISHSAQGSSSDSWQVWFRSNTYTLARKKKGSSFCGWSWQFYRLGKALSSGFCSYSRHWWVLGCSAVQSLWAYAEFFSKG